MSKYEISLPKFMKVYFNISSNKTKYLRHRDLKKLFPDITVIDCCCYDTLIKNIITGVWINVKDCDSKIVCYKNPEIDLTFEEISDFEKTDDFINKPLYYRFFNYEYDDNLLQDIFVDKNELNSMEKWELLELKRKLIKYNKISIGLYYAKIELVRNELSRRKKKEQVVNKQYLKKKGEIYNDEY